MRNDKKYLSKAKLGRVVMLGLFSLSLSAGCATLSSPGSWLSRDSSASTKQSSSGLATALSDVGSGLTGQVKTMGTTVSSAMGKAKNFVTKPYGEPTDKGDPTSLANMPSNLGPELWITNGQLFETQGKYSKAQENYTKALEVEPNNESALLSLARLHARQQQYTQAEQFFARAQAIRPQADTLNEIALLQQKQGKTAESQATLQKAIELDPTSPRYRNNLASMLVSSGRSEEAVRQLQSVFPPAVANYNVAYLHFTNQNLPAAQQHLQIALHADPNLQPARDLMASISGNPTTQSALAAYQTANQIFHTAQQGMSSPNLQAEPAIYPLQSSFATPVTTAATIPSSPTAGGLLPPLPTSSYAAPASGYSLPNFGTSN